MSLLADDRSLLKEVAALTTAGAILFGGAMAKASDALVPKEPQDIVLWARENLTLPTSVSARSGPLELTPLQAAIARLWQTPGIRQVTFLKPTRFGSSLLNAAGLLYFSAHEGVDTIFYERTEPDAQDFHDKKLLPILLESTRISHLKRPDTKAGIQDSWTDRILRNGASMQLRSASNNGSFRAIKGGFICVDEAGAKEYFDRSKNSEGSKLTLIRRRAQEYAAPVIYLGGTPTNVGESMIWAEYQRSDKREFFMPCPLCGVEIVFKPDVRRQFDMSKPSGAGLRYQVGDRREILDCWYECGECQSRIPETEKIGMMEQGVLRATDVGEKGHAGVFAWAAHSTDLQMTWRHIAADHMKAEADPLEMPPFRNTILALPHDPSPVGLISASAVDANREAWTNDGPGDAEVVTVGIDVQKGSLTDQSKPPRIEATVLAGLPNQRNAVLAHVEFSHRLKEDPFRSDGALVSEAVEPFDFHSSTMLWELLERDWVLDDGRVVRAKCAFVDTGWNPETVHRWLEHPRTKRLNVVPIRGESAESRKRAPLLPANLRYADGRAKGRPFLAVGSQAAKDRLMECVAVPVPGPKSVTYALDLAPDYAEGLLAEALVEVAPGDRRWQAINKKRNSGEELDCLVYAYAAQRYLCRKDPRLARRLDEIDPAAQAAAEEAKRARAEAEAAKEDSSDRPVQAPSAGIVPRVVPRPAPADGSRPRFTPDAPGRTRRASPDAASAGGRSERLRRAAARSARRMTLW